MKRNVQSGSGSKAKYRRRSKVYRPYGPVSSIMSTKRVSGITNGFLNIRVKVELGTTILTSTNVIGGGYSFYFTLNDLPDVTSYVAIYDQYRINKVTAVIMPITQQDVPTSTASWAPLVTVIDYDDASVPTLYPAMLAYGSSMIHNNQQVIRRNFTPSVALGVSDGTNIVKSGVNQRVWLDCAQAGIRHYGFKAFVKQQLTTRYHSYYIYFVYDVSFQNTR